ncbi:hypothetical protein ACQPYA_30815 [Micromonospora sp. CA-263727]|uniref:hypothetical protein n=1 Tax=Micromonospora sp. CA-263727 TaxID=3239967 RepID=UPI003D90E000
MARRGFVTAGTALLVAVAMGAAGCGVAQPAQDAAPQAAVEVVAAMGAEGQALAALGFDPADLDTEAETPAPAESSAGERKTREERVEERRKRHAARVLLRENTLHGEAVVQTRDGGTKTVAVQRGEVTAIDGDTMTVKSADGFTMTWSFGDDLRVIERRRTIQSTDIKVGTNLGVAGAKTGDTSTARLVVVPARQN